MTSHPTDTIFALSSAAGRAGVSLFRVSGPKSAEVLAVLTGAPCPAPRFAALRNLRSADGGLIDQALCLYFVGPQSFTGEDCAELQCHGSLAVQDALARALRELGLRQAMPGEFTRRAVENGKMDLTEAEGLGDLIDAQTEGQRVQALRQMGGGLRDLYASWQTALLDAMAQIEGEIDFADEADVPDALSHAAMPFLQTTSKSMTAALGTLSRGQAVRGGIDVAIIGAPNAGKSTLINTLAGRDVAITSPVAGTTRDVVEATIVLAGLPVTLSDTAGLRESSDQIEQEGVARALRRAQEAQITLYLWRDGVSSANERETEAFLGADMVFTNVDTVAPAAGLCGNAKTGAGVDALLAALETRIIQDFKSVESQGLTRARHADCVEKAVSSTRAATTALGRAPELASEDIRAALRAIEELAGQSDIEQVFDRIFSQFCVGK